MSLRRVLKSTTTRVIEKLSSWTELAPLEDILCLKRKLKLQMVEDTLNKWSTRWCSCQENENKIFTSMKHVLYFVDGNVEMMTMIYISP